MEQTQFMKIKIWILVAMLVIYLIRMLPFTLIRKEIKNPYEENPTDIRAICFGANGDILGSNIYKQDIREILSGYTPAEL